MFSGEFSVFSEMHQVKNPAYFIISEAKTSLCPPCRRPKYMSVLSLLFVAICSMEKGHCSEKQWVDFKEKIKTWKSIHFHFSHYFSKASCILFNVYLWWRWKILSVGYLFKKSRIFTNHSSWNSLGWGIMSALKSTGSLFTSCYSVDIIL